MAQRPIAPSAEGGGTGTVLQPHLVGSGGWHPDSDGGRLSMATSDGSSYSDAQLDDYHGLPHERYPWQPPVMLALRARFSHPQATLRGTAGFGWWNAPFNADRATEVNVGPRVAWFFFGSAPSQLGLEGGWSGNGFFAQVMNVPTFPAWLNQLALWSLKVPLVGKVAEAAAGRVGGASECPLHDIELTAWHEYEIRWHRSSVQFLVDGALMLQTDSAPTPPLGLVIWIDNQWATTSGRGGLLALHETQWLEVEGLRVTRLEDG